MNDTAIEQEIQAKGLTAPRITLADIKDAIVSVNYFTAMEGVRGEACSDCSDDTRLGDIVYRDDDPSDRALELLTFCVIVLRNGFTVTGESAPVSPENFNAEIGRKIARDNAINKIWMLEGYLLKERLHQRAQQGCAG